MPSPRSLMACLTLSLSLLAVSSCAKPAGQLQTYPPAPLLQTKSEPARSIDTLTSAQANNEYWQSVKAWGREGWGQVAALCVWAKERGMPDLSCAPPADP